MTRVPSTATRVCGRGAPARASSSMSSPTGETSRSSLRAIGASNDWKKKRSTRNPGANAADGARVSRYSHSMKSPIATSAAEIVSLPAISSGSRVDPSRLCVRTLRISAPAGIAISAHLSTASLLSTRTIWCVSVVTVPPGKIRITARSSTMTAGAV